LDYILGPLLVFKGRRKAFDDNFVDRISRYYTVSFLLFFNIYVVTEEFVGEPIYCWCPAEFTWEEVDYVHYVCWVSNTYYLPISKQIPANYQVRREESDEIAFYQWVPLMLFLMALLCHLPRLAWRYLTARSGFEVKKMVTLVKHYRHYQAATPMKPMEDECSPLVDRADDIARYMHSWLKGINRFRAGIYSPFREWFSTFCFGLGCGRHFGNYYISLTLFVRFLYFLNAIGQLFLLNEFLGNRFYIFGWEILVAFVQGSDWSMSPRFPRMTLCDIDLRQLTNVQRWTFQCVLPINMYNEKFFVFLWFWFVIISFLSLLNFIATIILALVPNYRETFVKKYLKTTKIIKQEACTKKTINKFIFRYLKQDGVFVLKQISDNTNTVVTQDVFKVLWELFIETEKQYDNVNKFPHLPDDPNVSTPLIISNGTLHHISEEEIMKRTRLKYETDV